MRKIYSALLCTCMMVMQGMVLHAGEGMWLPMLISQRIEDMQAKGFTLSAEDIYSVNQASLKDAVVMFGRGCSGELISGEGLLITNHHCGYGEIQKHSSVEHDYLKDGFWAMNRREELPNEGLTVSFLERMEDVTGLILNGYSENMREAARDSLVKAHSAELISKVKQEGAGIEASVESMYYGNQYFLFVYKVYKDVRLVGAPPSSIGKFGGDTDNWMWPRHTGDFSLFRIYAGKDNEPAEYSEDNVPYSPKKFFKIALGGVKEGDFTMIYGYPGSTREYITSAEVSYIGDVSDPEKIALRTMRLDIQKKYMDADRDIKIRYSSKNAGVANAWKKWQGEMLGLRRLETVKHKLEYENRFEEWAKGSEYEGVTGKINGVWARMTPYRYAADYFIETAYTIEAGSFASTFAAALDKAAGQIDKDPAAASEAANFGKLAAKLYKDYYMPIDKDCFMAVMEVFDEKMPQELKPEFFKKEVYEHGSVAAYGEHIFGNSIFASADKAADFASRLDVMLQAGNLDGFKAALEEVKNDPALMFRKRFFSWYNNEISPVSQHFAEELRPLYRTYMRGQMAFEPERSFYPDANMTLRIAYGNVDGYEPKDGVYYRPVSTLEGIIEKDNPEIFDYDIPQKLRELHLNRDYGRWWTDGTVPACFLATNHTSGGNSGSPVIDRNGNLIGINFDRVWEGTMSDINFDPQYCRNISLDIRYALFLIDKLAGAEHLIDEMEFVK